MQSNTNPVFDTVYMDMYVYIMEIADVLQSFYHLKLKPANVPIPSRVDLEDISKTIIIGFIPNDPMIGNPLGYAIEDWCIWRDTLELFINGRFASILLKVYYSLKANRFITDNTATFEGHLVYIATDYIGYNLRFVHALRANQAPMV